MALCLAKHSPEALVWGSMARGKEPTHDCERSERLLAAQELRVDGWSCLQACVWEGTVGWKTAASLVDVGCQVVDSSFLVAGI